MNTPDYTEKFMDLANKELVGDEKMQLEKEINENPSLAEEYKKHLLAQDLLEVYIAQNLKRKLESLALTQMNGGSSEAVIKKLVPSRYKFAIAASVALVLGFSSYVFLGNKYSYPNVAAGYSLEVQEVRGTNPQFEDIIEKASKYISNKDYTMAISTLQQITEDDDRYFLAQLLIGNANFQKGAISEALTAFQSCENSNLEYIKLEGQYGYLLCRLKLDLWTDSDQIILQQLADNDGFRYKDDALTLLKQLSVAKFFHIF
jgi:hypothetical protein